MPETFQSLTTAIDVMFCQSESEISYYLKKLVKIELESKMELQLIPMWQI